jgi:lipopolysaccharide export system permease protein
MKKNNNEIKKVYFSEFNTTRLYIERNFNHQPVPLPDTQKVKKLPVFNTWALFDSLSLVDKREVLLKAIANVKEGSSFLSQKQDYIHQEVKTLRQFQAELHKKLTMSFACLVFFLIGAPLGAIIRKGGLGTPAVISILFFVVYYVLSISFEKMVKEDLINTIAGMWAASYILLPIGIFLTYKATTDSSILNVETYLNFANKIRDFIFRFFFKTKHENSTSVQ